MALKKGTVDVSWTDEKGVKDTPWYDTIDYEKMKTPPHLGRNAKGWRFDFSSYENLHQKAMEIKEKYPYLYKNENDVYKDAHYIGMYLLERVLCHNPKFEKFDRVLAMSSERDSDIVFKEFLQERFVKTYESFVKGIISESDLLETISEISSALHPPFKKWFEKFCDYLLSSDYEAKRVSGVLRQRDYREKIQEAKRIGMTVI
jgi:hypothetical protein